MLKIIFVLLMLTQNSQASWVGRMCSNIFSKIAVDDPHQYEEVVTDALLYYYTQHGIKGAWGRLEKQDSVQMNIMGAELRWRLGPVMVQFELPENINRINEALELYQEFEGQAVITKDKKK